MKSVASSNVAQQIANVGMEPLINTPRKFAAFIKSEIERWAKAVKATGLPTE